MNVPLKDAYREACLAIGEGIVLQRLQAAELHRLAPEPEPAVITVPTEEAEP